MHTSPPRIFRYSSRSIAPLGGNSEHVLAASSALSLYRSESIYTFIPKNACSTMRYTLALEHGMITGPEQFHWVHQNNPTFRATLPELIRAKYTFVVLRDPFARLASCFLDKFVDRNHEALFFRRMMNEQLDLSDITFRQFVTLLPPHLSGNEHWRPQITFLVYRDYDDYFCVEDFPAAAARLRERIGLEVRDARDLTRHGSDQYKPVKGRANFADTPAHEIAAIKRAGQIPRYAQMYDRALAASVVKLYPDDLQLYAAAIGRPCLFDPKRLA